MRLERSFLFVPADRPERYLKAVATGTDSVVVDLEDAVLPEAKSPARQTLSDWLDGPAAVPIAVRVNGFGTPWHADDLDLVVGNRRVETVILPKADDRRTLEALTNALAPHQKLIALVETIRGYFDIRDLAKAHGLSRIAFGSVDFCTETGIKGLGAELDAVRTELVIASRAAGLPAPIEGVTLDVSDHAMLAADIDRARRFGFGAKLCIHPSQVQSVNAGFSPLAEEIAWAQRVVESARAGGAVVVDGKLVDRPIVEQARQLLLSVA